MNSTILCGRNPPEHQTAATRHPTRHSSSNPTMTSIDGPAALPTSFRLSGKAIAKESHKQPIYCVDWATDVFLPENQTRPDDDNRPDASDREDDAPSYAGGSSSDTPSKSRSNRSGEESDSDDSKSSSSSSSSSEEEDVIECDEASFRCLASCGGNHVTIYETRYGIGLNPRQAYRDADKEEVFYVCAFGGRGLGSEIGYAPIGQLDDGGEPIVFSAEDVPHTVATYVDDDGEDDREGPVEKRRKLLKAIVNLSKYNGPQLLLVAGKRGIVKVIDTVRRSLILTLSGHGDEIYDMKFSPTIDDKGSKWLLLTASKDESLRLWNVQSATCIAIFAGHDAHRDAVLTCGWHPLGNRFVSGGMDNSVKIWSLESDQMMHAIEESWKTEPITKRDTATSASRPQSTHKVFKTLYEQTPIFSTSKVHLDYCDCVQFVGDLVLSKSINDVVILWKPIFSDSQLKNNVLINYKGNGKAGVSRIPNEVQPLREFVLNKCDIWFIRFQTDADCRMLAIGNNIGEIKVWDICTSNPTKKFLAKVDHQTCCSPVRMVSFSPDGRSLASVCDDSTVWKWDGQQFSILKN